MDRDGIERIRFDGRFAFKDGRASRFSVAGSFRSLDPTDLSIELFWHGDRNERQQGDVVILGNRMNHIWIPNDDPGSGHLEVLGLSGNSTSYGKDGPISTTLECSAIQVGIHKTVEASDRKYRAEVRLMPSGLFSQGIFEQHYTGEIKRQRISEDPIIVGSGFGELTVDETYQYEKVEEFGNSVTKQVGNSTIFGEIVVPKGMSLYEANERLLKELDSVGVALSLCYRQLVQYFQVRYTDMASTEKRRGYLRRKLPKIRKRTGGDELINWRNLSHGGLQKIVNGIKDHRHSADLARAINFLAASYDSTLENAFFLAFSAMETVVNIACDERRKMGYTDGQWRKIQGAISKAINDVGRELEVDCSELVEKVSELKRMSFRRRVAIACEKLGPETSDLWPNQDFSGAIGEAASLRNGLFHGAAYSDSSGIFGALVRIQVFAERLIAKEIRWPDDQLWKWRDQRLRLINRSDQANSGENKGET